MSKGIIGDPLVDTTLIKEVKDVVGRMRRLAHVLRTNIRNLDEPSASRMRNSVCDIKQSMLDVDFIVDEHSRALLRKALGGK